MVEAREGSSGLDFAGAEVHNESLDRSADERMRAEGQETEVILHPSAFMGGMMRVLTLLLFAWIAVAPGAAHSQCLKCDPNTVTLKGIVYSKDFPGPPNYQSIRGGDERMRYWILRLDRPICVEGDDFDNLRVTNVREMQLAFMDASFYKRYRRYVHQGARFRVVGSLFHQETGHHVTKILIHVRSLVRQQMRQTSKSVSN